MRGIQTPVHAWFSGVAGALSVAGAYAESQADCCYVLSDIPQLEGKVHYPESDVFEHQMMSYWSLSAALEPWCMVLPESVEDVAATITTIANNQCYFGIRGGGHGTHALSNSLKHGVTVDMSFFNKTSYDPNTKIASIGPGAHWKDVYDTLTPQGVTVTGGRAGNVGVGGFLLGGGNSFHSGSHGFGCDQVVNYEIVLADGRVINADEKQHSELWRALKGGSGNFGLVTRFDVQSIAFEDPSRPEIWGGIVGYDYDRTDDIIEAFVDFTDNVANDVYSSSIMGWSYNPAAGGFSIRCVMDNVANHANSSAFDGYLGIQGKTSNSLRSGSMSNITAELVRDQRTYTIWFTGTYRNDARILHFSSERHEKMVAEIEGAIGADSAMFSVCQAQPMTESMISRSQGNNMLGLESRVASGPGIMLLIYVGVESAEDEAKALPFVESFYEDVEAYADSLDANWGWSYLNYAHRTQDPISGFGPSAVEHIRNVSSQYDPDGVFQRLRRSGFKIPE